MPSKPFCLGWIYLQEDLDQDYVHGDGHGWDGDLGHGGGYPLPSCEYCGKNAHLCS